MARNVNLSFFNCFSISLLLCFCRLCSSLCCSVCPGPKHPIALKVRAAKTENAPVVVLSKNFVLRLVEASQSL